MNDIEIIKDIIYLEDRERVSYIDINNTFDDELNGFITAIENLIAENKELKELLEEKTVRIGFENKEAYIPKSKVEKEIDKLNKKEKDLQNSISDEEREEHSDASISFDLMDIDIRRETLQSLLGKE